MIIVKNKDGFTLTEVLISLLIVSVIFAISVPTFLGVANAFKYKVLEHNTRELKDLAELYSYDFEKEYWYGSWNSDGEETLNNYVEFHLEAVNSGKYENNSNFINPFSSKKSILDYNTTLSSGDGYQPAIFLTNNSSFSYTGSGSTANIIGTIVAYFNTSGGKTQYIDFYYIKKDGEKSEFKLRLE